MGTDDVVRQRIKLLKKYGVSHKVIAAHMGCAESTFTRWWRRQRTKPFTTDHLDGLNRFIYKLRTIEPIGIVAPDDRDDSAAVKRG